jgi:hypothetical protein
MLNLERQVIMGRIPTGLTIWSLKRYTKDVNLWDRSCSSCRQITPVFEYEHRDEQERSLFSYLCAECAQKKLGQWLQGMESPDETQHSSPIDFDSAMVFYEQKNDGETLLLTRWSPEQRRRRLQIDE